MSLKRCQHLYSYPSDCSRIKEGNDPGYSVTLETAHPAKFPEKINEILNFDPELPPSLEGLEEKEESYDLLKNTYPDFKNYLENKYGFTRD
nr:hypothetical protein [Bacteroidota bacterium]